MYFKQYTYIYKYYIRQFYKYIFIYEALLYVCVEYSFLRFFLFFFYKLFNLNIQYNYTHKTFTYMLMPAWKG